MSNLQYEKEIHDFSFDLSLLEGKTIMISGATGMIGTYLVDVLLQNTKNCNVIALGRSVEKAKTRFGQYWGAPTFSFCEMDICKSIMINEKVDFLIHAASTTHPVAYTTEPISTIMTNVIGLQNMLDYAFEHHAQRILFLSSVEIYGENRGDVSEFDEDYCGYINCNTLRAGYPESKRVGEALCQAYYHEKGVDVVIPRLSRIFGPTLLSSDTKALSQFLYNALKRQDVVLKSSGNQYYSYLYVADAVKGILTCLLFGKKGEAYNIADKKCNITLKELATLISGYVGTQVVFDVPNKLESLGFSTATRAIMNSEKIQNIGWHAEYSIENGIKRTLEIISENEQWK